MSVASSSGRVGVVGAGIVGVRSTRELVGLGADGAPTNAGVVLVTRRRERRDQLAASFGGAVAVQLDQDATSLPDDVEVVIVARESLDHPEEVRAQIAAGRHVVSTADDPDVVQEILSMHSAAQTAGVTVVVGAAMSPGLSCLLARHASDELDVVDEVHVARAGAAGPACARQRLKALRGSGVDWRDGAWVRRSGFSGRELCWFPDPVAARDCYRGALSEPLVLVPAVPDARRVTARLAATRRDRALAPFPVLVPPPTEGGLGAIRIELRGERDGARDSVVYGALDRPAVAAACVASVVALRLLSEPGPPGALGLAALGEPLPMLRELARRGVRAARFEGQVVAGADVTDSSQNLSRSVQNSDEAADTKHSE